MVTQLFINGLFSAGLYLFIGTGFFLFIKTTRFFNITFGILITTGAYFSYFFQYGGGLSIFSAIIFGILVSTLLGCVIQFLIFKKLSAINASGAIKMMSSLGIYIVLQNLLSLYFGDETKRIFLAIDILQINIWFIHITIIQLITLIMGIIIWLSVLFFLMKTKIGTAIRAVACEANLSEICGISKVNIDFYTTLMGSAIASIAGILIACDVGMNPTMGMNMVLVAFVVVIIGGFENIYGVVLGSILVGMAQHLSLYFLNAQWQDTIVFIILMAFLIAKPEGFLGKKSRKAVA